jgi:hypothetical protein
MKIIDIISEDFGDLASQTADLLRGKFAPSTPFGADSLGWNLSGTKDTPAADTASAPNQSDAETSRLDRQNNKVVVVGDSLAVGTGGQIPNAIVDAKVGINSSAILAKAKNDKELQGADVAIISAGANDGAGANGKNPNSAQTIANLEAIRASLNAKKYVWILPYNRSVAKDIMSVVKSGDEVVDLAKTTTPGKDGIHPSSYAPIAKDAISKGGVTPGKPAAKGSVDTSTGKQKGSKNMVDPNAMKQYLSGKGLDKNSIAGLLANAKAESSFNSGAYIKSDAGQGQGGGLFGFHDPKDGKGEFTNMVHACGTNWQSNWQGQLDYALQASRYPKTGFKTPGSAAEWFVHNYERPKNASQQAAIRSQSANQFA